MESFNLNIIPGKDRPVCHASQFDIGRQFHVNLFEGFNVFTLDGAETISLSVRKPDGNVVTASVTNTSDSYVEFVTTEQMTACEGSNLCELKLEKGSDVIGTANFILEVEVDPLEGGVQSASEIDNLQTQIAGMVATEVADQYDSANVIFDAAPTAGHGVGYAVTSEGVKNELDPIKADVSGLQSDVGDLQTDVGNLQDDISDAYDDTATYAEGEIVIYDGVLYECTVTGGITTPESWDPTHWTATTIKALLALKQNSSDNSLATTNKTVVGAINEHESDILPLTKEKMVVVYATNGARFWIKRLGNTVQIEMNESSQMSFYSTWANLFTDNTYQTRAYLDSDFIGTANALYVPIGLVNGHQIIFKIEKLNGAIQIICDTNTPIYPQGSGIYSLA